MKDEKAPKSDEISSNERINEMSTCFIGLSEQTRLFDDVINACQEILPRFGLKPCYAHDHFDPRKSLQDTVVEMISHADYGIYDLSHWQGKTNDEWIMPRNVFIELGIAIALNRPILLLQDTESIKSGPRLPECLEGIRDRILPFSGPYKLKKALERSLPQLVNESPDQDWNKRHCVFGKRACEYREAHPFAKDWFVGDLPCLISDGKESDRDDFRNVIEEVFGLYSEVSYNYLDELPIANGYKFLLCTYCQTVRSTPYGIYRITPLTPGETFIDIGISIALEAEFKHKIPKILLTRNVQDVPSILKGYRVVVAQNSTQCKKQLLKFLPEVHQIARRTIVRSQPLPYIQVSLRQREKFNSTDKSSSNIEQEETSDNLKVEQEVIEIQEQASTSEPIGHHAKSIHSSIPARNVFLLGRPGSGKSMVARLIEMFAKENGWSAYYINDYGFLQNMFLQEEKELIPLKERKFSTSGPPEYNGFDVKDFSVLDTVLRMMAKEVEAWEGENESEEENKSGKEDKLCLIEFARDSYHDALQLFGSNLLQNAHLLYLDVDLETCIKRNHQYTDHFVSDEIMRTYYREDDWSRVMYNLQHNWDKCVIRNSGTLQDLKHEVEEWVDIHLKREVVISDGYDVKVG